MPPSQVALLACRLPPSYSSPSLYERIRDRDARAVAELRQLLADGKVSKNTRGVWHWLHRVRKLRHGGRREKRQRVHVGLHHVIASLAETTP